MMASQYERELRAVLIGSPDGVRAVTRSCNAAEKARAMQVIRRPFLVVRAAGSGVAGAGDLLAVRGDNLSCRKNMGAVPRYAKGGGAVWFDANLCYAAQRSTGGFLENLQG